MTEAQTILGALILGVFLIAAGQLIDHLYQRRLRSLRARDITREVEAGKRCPECFGKCLIRLPSMNAKLCADCHAEIPWHLSEGQVQTLAPSRAHRKVKPQ